MTIKIFIPGRNYVTRKRFRKWKRQIIKTTPGFKARWKKLITPQSFPSYSYFYDPPILVKSIIEKEQH